MGVFMDISILKGKIRNTKIEEYAIEQMVNKSCGCISYDDVKEALRKNHFKGIYVVTPEEFHEFESDENALGLYNHEARVIILDGEAYIKHPDIAIHELAHAYLCRHDHKLIKVDNVTIDYGLGLEEGFAALMQMVNNINDINQCKVNSYPYQASIFKQLNALYAYSDFKKYPNLMHHMLKEPETFLRAVHDIYAVF